MKKILFILCFLSFKAYAQEPTYVPMKSNYLYRGIKMDSLFLPPVYPDTATGTTKVNFAGSLIRVGSKLYMRNSVLTKWIDLSDGAVATDSTVFFTKYRSDTMRTNIYGQIAAVGTPNLQQVTTNGNTTTNDIQFINDNDLLMDTFSAVIFSNNSRLQEGYLDAGYGGNKGIALVCGLGYEYKWEGGRLFVMNNSGNGIREAKYMFTDVPNNTHDFTKGYYVGSRWVLDNGDTYVCTDNSLNASVWALQPNAFDSTSLSNRINNKVDSLNKTGDSVYYYKNGIGYFAFKDSIGGGTGFVPYTGATQDVDLGNNGLNARFVKVTGTAGNGHIDLKHQSGDATGQTNSTKLYANSSGYLKWKNDNLYYTTLATPQTANRVYTYQDKSYTLGDSADIAARVKYTDTATMLSPYLRKADTASLSNRIDLRMYADADLQDITDNGSITSNSISAYSYNIYDQTNAGYGSFTLADNYYLLKYADNTNAFSSEPATFTIFNGSIAANINTTQLTTNRGYNLPDKAGTFVLDVDTANMLRNYQRTSAFPVATFGAGSGAAGDTSAFTTSAIYGSFYNSGVDTIIVTSYVGVLQGTSPSITPTIYFNDSLNVTAGATKIVNSPSAVTSTTTGNTVTSLDNTKIPPGNFVWVTTGTVTTKPTYFSLTLIGYRKR